jgi:hypothetical protein
MPLIAATATNHLNILRATEGNDFADREPRPFGTTNILTHSARRVIPELSPSDVAEGSEFEL